LSENLKVRVPDDPSAMIGPKIVNIETFCLGYKTARRKLNQDGRMKDVLIFTPEGDVWNT